MPYLQQQMKTNNALLVSHVVGVPVYYSYLFQVKVIPKIDAFSASYIAVHFPCQARLLLTETAGSNAAIDYLHVTVALIFKDRRAAPVSKLLGLSFEFPTGYAMPDSEQIT
jgi:hypothetical protein